MMENSSTSENKTVVVDMSCLSKQELVLLSMFRAVGAQQQKDILRILEAFTHEIE